MNAVTGLYFEDFNVGDEWVTRGRTITEADVVAFAGLSGDYNRLHTDAEYCKEHTIFGERIAHGLLGLSIGSGLLVSMGFTEGTVMAFLGVNWNFTGPIKLGDTIHARTQVESKRETKKEDRGIVNFDTEVINQRGEVVQKGTRTLMIARRPK